MKKIIFSALLVLSFVSYDYTMPASVKHEVFIKQESLISTENVLYLSASMVIMTSMFYIYKYYRTTSVIIEVNEDKEEDGRSIEQSTTRHSKHRSKKSRRSRSNTGSI